MLNECQGPMNFTMFISKFAEKIGSADQEDVLINAFSNFDIDDTGLARHMSYTRGRLWSF